MAIAATPQSDREAACVGDFTERELSAWRGLLRSHASLVKALDAQLEQAHGLPLTSYEVLLFLDHAEGNRMRMCDLAESVLLSRSGLTRLIDRLEREELVVRVRDCDDARGAFAALTPAGRDKLGVARATHVAGIREHFLERFSDEELDQLAVFWERLAPSSTTAPGCGRVGADDE
jgi:DNA-binding MarR family transcriptional regulator